MLLGFRSDLDPLTAQDRTDPISRPAAFRDIIDSGEGLERNEFRALAGERATEVMPVTAHGDRGGSDRSAEIEGEDLRAGIAAELQRHQRQQYGLAGACRSDHQRVTDIADMK